MTFWAQMTLVAIGAFTLGFMSPEFHDSTDSAMIGLFITGSAILGAVLRGLIVQ